MAVALSPLQRRLQSLERAAQMPALLLKHRKRVPCLWKRLRHSCMPQHLIWSLTWKVRRACDSYFMCKARCSTDCTCQSKASRFQWSINPGTITFIACHKKSYHPVFLPSCWAPLCCWRWCSRWSWRSRILVSWATFLSSLPSLQTRTNFLFSSLVAPEGTCGHLSIAWSSPHSQHCKRRGCKTPFLLCIS